MFRLWQKQRCRKELAAFLLVLFEQIVECMSRAPRTSRFGMGLALDRHLRREVATRVAFVFGRNSGTDRLQALKTASAVERGTLRARV